MSLSKFFKKYNAIIIDIETSGFYPEKNSLLEIALVSIVKNDKKLIIDKKINYHVKINRNNILNINNINYIKKLPFFSFNFNISEYDLLINILTFLKKNFNNNKKNILIGHNIYFDISFLKKIMNKYNLKIESIHDYIFLDTTTLSLLTYEETVLIKALKKAKINIKKNNYHNGLYDAIKTAELFCKIINSKNK